MLPFLSQLAFLVLAKTSLGFSGRMVEASSFCICFIFYVVGFYSHDKGFLLYSLEDHKIIAVCAWMHCNVLQLEMFNHFKGGLLT